MKATSQTGREGEAAAEDFLKKMNHIILERNWRSGHLEIDIITLTPEGIHFVEVKTRRPPLSADPLSNITQEKMRRIRRAATAYLRQSRLPGKRGYEIFFDVVSVVLTSSEAQINYYPMAYTPLYV